MLVSTNHIFSLLFYILKQERERERDTGKGFELLLGNAIFLLRGDSPHTTLTANLLFRYLDTISPRIRHSQILHFHPNPPHRRRHAKSRQGPSWVGMGYR